MRREKQKNRGKIVQNPAKKIAENRKQLTKIIKTSRNHEDQKILEKTITVELTRKTRKIQKTLCCR